MTVPDVTVYQAPEPLHNNQNLVVVEGLWNLIYSRRSRSRVIPCTSLHKIQEMELCAGGMLQLFRLPASARFLFVSILDTVWQCLTLKRASFSMMRRCPRKLWPKEQRQWQRLLVVVLWWSLRYFVDVLLHQLSYHALSSREVTVFCCLVWLGSRFPISNMTTVSSNSVPLTGGNFSCTTCESGTGWSAQRYAVKCQF